MTPEVGLVLGSGLGGFAEELEDRQVLDLPGLPRSTAPGHKGELVVGRCGKTLVLVQNGRVHLYEGYTPQQVTAGIQAMKSMGVHSVILTNAAGGIRPEFARGALVLISDHINLQGVNPLTGPNDDSLGPRFPDMTEAYSTRYREIAREAGRELGIHLAEGVYAGLLGPSYETPAEIRYLRAIGADLVGMSTVAEAIVANHRGMRCLGISTVTNPAAGVTGEKLVHDEVLEVGRSVRSQLTALLKAIIPRLKP
jgi:purine-nucleoside phosphorylase